MLDADVHNSPDEVASRVPQVRHWRVGRKLVLIVLAVAVLVVAMLEPNLGMLGLVPFGLMLAFSTDPAESSRPLILTWRNAGLVTAMIAAASWLWLAHLDLEGWTRVAIAGALIAMPLALKESVPGKLQERMVGFTKRDLILALSGFVAFVFLYFDRGVWLFGFAAVAVLLPFVLATARVFDARRGRIEMGLLRDPLSPEVRPHLFQLLNVWVCCVLLGGVVAAGGTHFARIYFSLNGAQFGVVIAAFIAGLVLLAALAVVPGRRVSVAINVTIALLSGFLASQLISISASSEDAVRLDSPLTGDWFVQNGGRSILINGHPEAESNAVDFQLMGANGRTHTGGSADPLTDYAGFGSPVFAPADGRVVEVTEGYADNAPGTNGDEANHLVVDIGGGRYVAMAHVQQGSVQVEVGDLVRRGQLLAAVGNNGHSSAPHLHLQVQDTPAGSNAPRTYPILFGNVQIVRGGVWPWGDNREVRTGDLVRAAKQ